MARAVLIIIILFATTGAIGAGAGKKMYDEFVENGQIYPHEGWQEYVTSLGQKLLQHASSNAQKYRFIVLDNAQINAFATPDAFIFVNRGLLAFLSSEEQLAAVIGHEIGHVVGEHARRRKMANLLGKTAGIAAAMVTGRGELYDVSNVATTTLLSGYGREMELEADRYGAEFLARSGYNPLAMIEVVQVLKDQELFSKQVANLPSTYHGLFSSHPKNDKRLHEVVTYAQSQLPERVT
ncbi:MAG: M48 family metalloprotease [Pseudomonadota bacterium]|nr:M48 family metalloprotease [Pseudomonadota bacterium]